MPATALDDLAGARITTARRAVLPGDGATAGSTGPLELVFDYTRARTLRASPGGGLQVELGPWRAPAGPARWELADVAAEGVGTLRGATVVGVEWEHDGTGTPVGVRVLLAHGGQLAVRAAGGDLHVRAEHRS